MSTRNDNLLRYDHRPESAADDPRGADRQRQAADCFWGGAPREITRLGTASRRARTQESSRGGADRLVRRCLILARGVPSAQINDTVRHLHLLDARIDLLLHDFDDPGRNERILAGRP